MRPLFDDPQYVSPFLMIDSIPALARNETPAPLLQQLAGIQMDAWRLLEEAVFFGFRSVLGRSTTMLGADRLFEHEPEGVVLEENVPEPCAMLYECKARSGAYLMSSDDVLRYKDYIRRKRVIVQTLYKLPLRHFVIIAPSFDGDTDRRVNEIAKEGVTLSLITGDDLRYLLRTASDMTREHVALIDLREILSAGVAQRQRIDNAAAKFRRYGEA